ncbi:MAG TPA: DNA-formamidopyrimidine glycosylase family protein [Acidimicrobiales bacterium]|nr:DNA-formamidopyrimidine glycosylase family protein [Acidimicrobiales bacterium]
MPELPEVEALARYLTAEARGRRIERVELAAVAALKTFDPPLDALVGDTVAGCGRRGKFLCVETTATQGDALWLVIHLARGGWVRVRQQMAATRPGRGKGPLALRVALEGGGGLEVTEAGTEKRLALYVVPSPDDVAGIARLGPDALDPALDAPTLGARLAASGAQLKKALTDQTVLAGVGNAYSDEVLHAARLSPFKSSARLSQEEVQRLHAALVAMLKDAVERSVGLAGGELKSEKRSGMRVHARAGEACPACRDTVREVSFASTSLQYCPSCQTGGKPLADRRLSRLLK